MQIERESILSQKEKLFLITKFTEEHPEADIQDFYKWLYFGEFGVEEFNNLLAAKKQIPENRPQYLYHLSGLPRKSSNTYLSNKRTTTQ